MQGVYRFVFISVVTLLGLWFLEAGLPRMVRLVHVANADMVFLVGLVWLLTFVVGTIWLSKKCVQKVKADPTARYRYAPIFGGIVGVWLLIPKPILGWVINGCEIGQLTLSIFHLAVMASCGCVVGGTLGWIFAPVLKLRDGTPQRVQHLGCGMHQPLETVSLAGEVEVSETVH